MKRALAYILAAITGPRRGFTLMLFDEGGFAVSIGLLLAVAFAWALTFLGWALAGWEPWGTPWLAIPPDVYYGWETLFAVPVILLGWLLASGFVQLMSRQLGGGGSFEATARLLALSIAVCNFVLLLPALVLAVLAVTGVLDAEWWQEISRPGAAQSIVWFLGAVSMFWLGSLTTIAVRAAHKTRSRRSLLVAIPTVVLYHGFVLVFLR